MVNCCPLIAINGLLQHRIMINSALLKGEFEVHYLRSMPQKIRKIVCIFHGKGNGKLSHYTKTV